MKELLHIINLLKGDSSRGGKELILEKHKENQLFREVLEFVYNPYIVTGLSTKKINSKVTIDTNTRINSLSELMFYLKENNTGRHLDIAVVHKFLGTILDEDERELVKEIVTKSLKVGLTEKTINKVYGKNTIKSFNVQLAEPFSKKSDKIKGEFFVTLKLDGNRVIAIKENDKVKFFTRKGQPIEGLNQLEQHMKPLLNGFVYDGELLLVNTDNLNSADLFRATQKVVRKDGAKENLEFYIFDTLTIEEFQEGKSKNTYKERRKKLEEFNNVVKEDEYIHVLPVMHQGSDKSVIGDLMKQVVNDGYEGLMVNTADGKYQTKRTTDLQKVKEFHSCDGIIKDVYEGTGKNKGRLGGIEITFEDIIVKIGSGFSDEERVRYWGNPNAIIGKIGEYQYFEQSENQNGGKDLRFATWKGLRLDKGKDDVNYE